MAILEINGRQVDIPDFEAMDGVMQENAVNEIAASMQQSEPQQATGQGGLVTETPQTETPVTQTEQQLMSYAQGNQLQQPQQSIQELYRQQLNTNERIRRATDVINKVEEKKAQLQIDGTPPPVEDLGDVRRELVREAKATTPEPEEDAGWFQRTLDRINREDGIRGAVEQGNINPAAREAFQRGLAQGSTFNLADEASAGAQALFAADSDTSFSDAYQTAREESRAADQAAREASPIAYGAGEVVGSVTAGLPAGGLTGGAGRRIAATAGIGAVESALSAAGETSADTGTDRWWQDVGTGAATGAVLAPIFSGVGSAISEGIKRIPTSFTSRLAGGYGRQARDEIGNELRKSGLTEEQAVAAVQRMEDQGLVPSLADIPELESRLRQTVRRTQIDEPTRASVRTAADDAVGKVSDVFDPKLRPDSIYANRVVQSTDLNGNTLQSQITIKTTKNNLNKDGTINVNQFKKSVESETERLAGAGYDKAFAANNAKLNDLPADIIRDEAYQEASQRAIEQIRKLNISKHYPANAPISETQILHQTQLNLNDMAKKAKNIDKVTLGNTRRTVLNALELNSPEYAHVKDIYRTGKEMVQGIEAGKRLTVKSLTDAEAQEIIDNLQTTGNWGEAVKTYGALMGSRVREGWRDGKTNKVLTTQERSRLKQMFEAAGKDFDEIGLRLNATDSAIRKNHIANMDALEYRRAYADKFITKMSTDDMNLAFGALMLSGNYKMAALQYGLRKFGESGVVRRDLANLEKAMQKEMFQKVKPDDVRAFFKGDIDAVPADSIKKIMDVLGVAVSTERTNTAIEDRNRYYQ